MFKIKLHVELKRWVFLESGIGLSFRFMTSNSGSDRRGHNCTPICFRLDCRSIERHPEFPADTCIPRCVVEPYMWRWNCTRDLCMDSCTWSRCTPDYRDSRCRWSTHRAGNSLKHYRCSQWHMCTLAFLFRYYRDPECKSHSYHKDSAHRDHLERRHDFNKQTSRVFKFFAENNDGHNYRLRGSKGLQLTKGLPVICLGQLQTGVIPRRLQSAFTPQTPSQGFTHFWYKQAGLLAGHSEWEVHSGRHEIYGFPSHV